MPKLFSFPFSTLSFNDTTRKIIELAQEKKGAYVCATNVHMTVEALRNPAFASVLSVADLAILDGMPLCWSYKILYSYKPDRIAGKHIMHALLLEASEKNIPVFFYGSTIEKLARAKTHLLQNYPDLQIAGMLSPPFRPLRFDELHAHAYQINSSGASLVFVALGCPKQEMWMHNMKDQIQATMVGVGGALDVLTGQQKRPPTWIENAGLEWFFRLCLEPRRLFKRYLITNSYFIYFLCKEIVMTKLKFNKS